MLATKEIDEDIRTWKESQKNPITCPCGGTANGYDIGQGTCDRCSSPVYSDGSRGGGDGHNHEYDRR
jgi:hypothetical protein